MSWGVGCNRGLDPVLPWLWYRPVAMAPIRPLSWEPPCASGTALKKKKKEEKKKKRREPFEKSMPYTLDIFKNIQGSCHSLP